MPVVMIVLFAVGPYGLPAGASTDFPSLEVCVQVAADLHTEMSAGGVCLDRFTGQTVFWGLDDALAEEDQGIEQ